MKLFADDTWHGFLFDKYVYHENKMRLNHYFYAMICMYFLCMYVYVCKYVQMND